MKNESLILQPIAHIHSQFPQKFGIPRQSGLVEELRARVVFEREYRIREAFRGLEDFSHLWLLWQFTESHGWSPTVRPPRLGGNQRMGVFATRLMTTSLAGFKCLHKKWLFGGARGDE